MIQVKVAKLGEAIKEVLLEEGSTVRDALTAAGHGTVPSGHQVRRRNAAVDMSAEVHAGEIITLVPKISAG